MLNSKLIAFFRTLDKKELSNFDKYLQINCAKQEIILKVFSYLKRFHPLFDHAQKLETAYAYEQIFGESIEADDYNRTKLLNALSDLLAYLKKFLLYQKITEDSPESDLLWARILLGKGIENEFSKQITSLKEKRESLPSQSLEDDLNKLMVSYLYYYRGVNKKLESDNTALQNCIRQLDSFHALVGLKLACEMKTRQQLLSVDSEEQRAFQPEVIIESIPPTVLATNPLLAVYCEMYQLITKGTLEYYDKVEALLKQHVNSISQEDQHVLVSYLQNYAAEQSKRSGDAFLERAHALNCFAMEHKIFDMKSAMSPTQFNNIVAAACKCGELEWAKGFVKEYSNYLEANIRKDTVIMSEAIIAFSEGKFEEVLEKLRDTTFTDVHYAIRTKCMILRSYCELHQKREEEGKEKIEIEDWVLSFCYSFERYLERNKKLKGNTITATLNFVKVLKRMLLRRTKKDVMIEFIKSKDALYFTDWLTEKAAFFCEE